ncbi:hypothetical protein LOTGIDRAFT_157836 [Lottia gigantea]|uniref:Uncharacterized protein n=1 Tax=Lottia gigantea TaxID=225164 RepID=V4CEY8_LOTGI|nr:hypothetical protein LOTGIDRAFT_157836 [Lottia gigantea]ESP00560.1 hypothetical protein LOTGIDRAFT_157836 [Lottia gigantea]
MELNMENDYVDKIMLKFLKENSKLAGKNERITVWSQSTNYPGALGIHSENSRVAAARNSTADQSLKNTVSAMESIHKKEIKSIDFSKRNVEDSMVAYSQKMRRISSDKYFDRIKIQNDLENSKKWTNMSKLYEEAIRNATPEVKYTLPIDRGRSVSLSQPKVPKANSRKISSQEQTKPQLIDESTGAKDNKLSKRSRRAGTIDAPEIIVTDTEKLPPITDKLPALEHKLSPSKDELSAPEDKLSAPDDKPQKDFTDNDTSRHHQMDRTESPRTDSCVVIAPYPDFDKLTEGENMDAKTAKKTTKKKKGKKTVKKKTPRISITEEKPDDAESCQIPSPSKTKTQQQPVDEGGIEKASSSRKVSMSKKTKDQNIECHDVSPRGFNPHRRRSLSMPTSPRPNVKHKSLVDCNGNEIVLKSVLRHRKTSDITYLVRKSVQFQLPDIDKHEFESYTDVKCEQSPNTVIIVRDY